MTNKQKIFIAAAKPKRNTIYKCIYLCDSGKQYDGFYGKNGFNSLIIIGQTPEGEFELISDYSDVFSCLTNRQFDIDINKNDGMIRIFFDSPVQINYVLSTCAAHDIQNQKKAEP